jgi:hypothetical protein
MTIQYLQKIKLNNCSVSDGLHGLADILALSGTYIGCIPDSHTVKNKGTYYTWCVAYLPKLKPENI